VTWTCFRLRYKAFDFGIFIAGSWIVFAASNGWLTTQYAWLGFLIPFARGVLSYWRLVYSNLYTSNLPTQAYHSRIISFLLT